MRLSWYNTAVAFTCIAGLSWGQADLLISSQEQEQVQLTQLNPCNIKITCTTMNLPNTYCWCDCENFKNYTSKNPHHRTEQPITSNNLRRLSSTSNRLSFKLLRGTNWNCCSASQQSFCPASLIPAKPTHLHWWSHAGQPPPVCGRTGAHCCHVNKGCWRLSCQTQPFCSRNVN